MKRPLAVFFIFVCAFVIFAGTAFAGSAPAATSYFTNSSYNKTYTGDDGLNHTMKVTWVGETWNKVGTVIYSINYEDVYQQDANTYIDVKSATEIYENARPTYPDSPQHSVYQVKWYSDGHKEVISDYRPASPEQTPAPTPTKNPTPAPSTKPEATPSAASTGKATTEPTNKATPKPTVTPTSPPASTSAVPSSPTPPEGTPTVPSSPSPTVTEAQGIVTTESVTPSASTPLPEETERSQQNENPSPSKWVWIVIAVAGIGAVILLASFLKGRRRKEKNGNEDHKA